MIKNYLKITARNILKHKGYSLINITGLAMGIACCLLIFIYVKGELTYDKYQSKEDRIFRLTAVVSFAGNTSELGASGYPEGQAYHDGIPEIESLVRVNNETAVVRIGDDFIAQNDLVYADPALFDVFDFRLMNGALDEALQELNNLVITKRMALKYFDRTDVIGESIEMNVDQELETFYITAVIDNHPSNSSFDFQMVMPWAKHEAQMSAYRLGSWGNISINSFVLLNEGASVATVEEKMKEIRAERNPGEDGEFARGIVNKLQPLTDIHLNTEIRGGDGLAATSDSSYSYILSGIALIILIVACINFTNMSVARSLPRAREIGVRKVLGALKPQLAFQFLSEALVMCLIAFVLGLIMAEMALPVFGELTERTFYDGIVDDVVLMGLCFLLVVITALLSGFYPAFIISRFKTINSLKGKVRLKGNSVVSKVLVVIQFTIAAVLVIGTITMNRQIDYMVNMDLGYDDENLLRIEAYGSGTNNLSQLLKDELGKDPNIVGVAGADSYGSYTGTTWGENQFAVAFNDIDDQYFDMMGLELLEGRKLKKGRDIYISPEGDTLTNILVNEAYVRETGEEDLLLKINDSNRIVGIVKDYHFTSVQGEILPLMMVATDETGSDEFEVIYVKYNPEYLGQVKSVVEQAWRKFVPLRPFDAVFVAESNALRYEDETRWRRIITYASLLAISISALGLFGLAHLTTQQRIKEIGIRKVLGASLSQIILMLNSNFARLVLISTIIATPVAYYFIDQWLQNFANAVNITVALFLIPGLITFLIAFVTVSLQSLKSARANPVDSLRYE